MNIHKLDHDTLSIIFSRIRKLEDKKNFASFSKKVRENLSYVDKQIIREKIPIVIDLIEETFIDNKMTIDNGIISIYNELGDLLFTFEKIDKIIYDNGMYKIYKNYSNNSWYLITPFFIFINDKKIDFNGEIITHVTKYFIKTDKNLYSFLDNKTDIKISELKKIPITNKLSIYTGTYSDNNILGYDFYKNKNKHKFLIYFYENKFIPIAFITSNFGRIISYVKFQLDEDFINRISGSYFIDEDDEKLYDNLIDNIEKLI